jgi:hypothetical protein
MTSRHTPFVGREQVAPNNFVDGMLECFSIYRAAAIISPLNLLFSEDTIETQVKLHNKLHLRHI